MSQIPPHPRASDQDTPPLPVQAGENPPPVPIVTADIEPKPTVANGLSVLLVSVIAVVGVVALLLGGGVVWLLTSRDDPQQQSPVVTAAPANAAADTSGGGAAQGTPIAPTRAAPTDDLQKEIRKLQSERAELEDEKRSLERSKADLQNEKVKLENEIRDLTSQLETIRSFRKATFVMLNPTSYGVGLSYDGERGFSVVAKAEAETAQLSSQMAFNSKIPRIARNPALTRRIFNASEIGDAVPANIAREISEYYKEHRFVPYKPKERVQMVAFRDVETRRFQLGFYESHDDRELQLRSFSGVTDRVAKSRIEPGSARKGWSNEMVVAVEEMDFIDYSLLQVAKHLGSPEGFPSHVAVAIHMDVDLPESVMAESVTVAGGISLFGGMLNLSGQKTWTDSRVKFLETLAMRIEDEIYSKLTKLSVPVLEREELASILLEHQIRAAVGMQSTDLGMLACASHVLIVELGPSTKPGHVRTSIRLDDAYTSEVVWSEAADRRLQQDLPANQHHLTSGRLAIVNESTGKLQIAGRRLNLPAIDGEIQSRLVYLEPALNRGDRFAIRDLFGKKLTWIERQKIVASKSRTIGDVSQIPNDNIMRYLVWNVCDTTLPYSGRVTKVDGATAEINFATAQHRLAKGTKLKIVRYDQQLAEGQGVAQLLPLELTVSSAGTNSAKAEWGLSPVETLWSDTVQLEPGDVAYPKGQKRAALAVPVPVVESPSRERWKALRLDNPVRRKQVEYDTLQAAKKFSNLMQESCLKLNIPVVEGNTVAEVVAGGATHIVGATIKPFADTLYDVRLSVYSAAAQDPIRELEVRIGKGQLEGWQP